MGWLCCTSALTGERLLLEDISPRVCYLPLIDPENRVPPEKQEALLSGFYNFGGWTIIAEKA